MTRSIHEHQWVYLGDLALTVSSRETDVSLRRLEVCIECSTLQVQFSSGWYVMRPEATKKFLEDFDEEAVGICVDPPQEFRIRSPERKKQKRLGRGLADLSNRPRLARLPGDKRD